MPVWNDITDESYWTPSFGMFGSSKWTSGDFGGYQFVGLLPGSWATGYASLIIRVTFSTSALVLSITGTLNNAEDTIDSGDELDLTGIGDLTFFQFGGTESPFEVTKIELYGESLGGEDEDKDMPYSGPYRMFTRNYAASDINYIFDWEYDQLASGFASGNDEVAMRCMRLFEMEPVSGDTKVGMLLFTDTDSTGRQTGTVVDSTQYLFDREYGIATDVIEADDNALFIFEKNPTDLSGGTDESDFPVYLRKYIEYAVLERAYAADTDGQIASLRDYWAMRKTIGLKAIKLFMGKRKADRNYRMTTKGVTGWRTRRAPRLPDSYPSVVR